MKALWTMYSLRSVILCRHTIVCTILPRPIRSGDTAQAELLVKQAMEYNYQIEYDSSIICLQKAAKIFLEAKSWERYVHCLNIIADCLLRKVALDSMETVLAIKHEI